MIPIIIILVVLWLLGVITKYTLGGLLHILLVVAIIWFVPAWRAVPRCPEAQLSGFSLAWACNAMPIRPASVRRGTTANSSGLSPG